MNSLPEEIQLQSLLQGVDFPPCPAILLALDKELRKDAPEQREIASLISQDVALSGHLMQIANSPAFSTGRPLNSIIQALQVLGTQQVFNLLVTQLLKVALAGAPEVPMDAFWEKSALTARLCAEVARRLRCVRADVAYTFGLFHDCGIPLIMKRFPNAQQALAEAEASEDVGFTEVEEHYLGTNHAVVGYFLARRWHLPTFVAEGILYHHDYRVLREPGHVSEEARGLIAVAALAEHIIEMRAKQGRADQAWARALPVACEFFGLSLGAIDDLIEDVNDWLA